MSAEHAEHASTEVDATGPATAEPGTVVEPNTAGEPGDVEPASHASTELAHLEHERPEDWGWHHEFRTGRQVGGWISFLILAALLTASHYNRAGSVAIVLAMVAVAGGLLWDRRRRRHQWRS